MKERINDKIKEINMFLEELERFLPSSYEEYITDIKTKAACERYFEKIIEACVDLSFLVIKFKNFDVPQDDKGSFEILAKEGVINQETSQKFKDAKGMRNILAHEYGKVDDSIVHKAVTTKLIEDVSTLLTQLEKNIQ